MTEAVADSSGDLTKWSAFPSMLSQHVFPGVCLLNNNLFVFGGCDESGMPISNCEMIPLESGVDAIVSNDVRWKPLPLLLSPRAGTKIVTLDNDIYSVGGVGANKVPVSNIDKFDIGSQLWTQVAALPVGLQGCMLAERQGRIVIAGGMGDQSVTYPKMLMFDPKSGKVANLPGMSEARYSFGHVLHNDTFYVFGGRNGRNPLGGCEAFDFRTCKWRSLPNLPEFRRVFPMFANIPGHVVAMGGLDPENVVNGMCCHVHSFDLESEQWNERADLLIGRADSAVFSLPDSSILLAGGLDNNGKPSSSCHRFDFNKNVWSEHSTLTTSHMSCGGTMTENSTCFVIGGIGEKGLNKLVEVLSIPS